MELKKELIPFHENTQFIVVYHWWEVTGSVEVVERENNIYNIGGTIVTYPSEGSIFKPYRKFMGTALLKTAFIAKDDKKYKREEVVTKGGPTKVVDGYCLWEIAYKEVEVVRNIHGINCTFVCSKKENGEDENTVILHLERIKKESYERDIIVNFKELMEEKTMMEESFKEENERRKNEGIQQEWKRREEIARIEKLQQEYKNFLFLKKWLGGEELKKKHYVSD